MAASQSQHVSHSCPHCSTRKVPLKVEVPELILDKRTVADGAAIVDAVFWHGMRL